VPLKLFFALHEVEAKFTEKQLRAVIVLWWKGREIPCIYLISPKFYLHVPASWLHQVPHDLATRAIEVK
jgi:hypothetical protein